MADDTALELCDQRQAEGSGGAERLDNVVLGLVADFQELKRGCGHLGYDRDILVGFASDLDAPLHGPGLH